MDIGIVTSFYNRYDRFLPDWLTSVYELKTKPAAVTIVISGDKYEAGNIRLDLLQKIGVSYKIINIPEHKGMGYARNEAVRQTETEWIMYLDVDDVILPNAIDDVAKYQDKADVICTGVRSVGVYGNKDITFLNASRERQLKGLHCSASHSPYKKKLWQTAPYITQNDFIEQNLWLGFAQAGARFIGIPEICTVYRSRADGHNATMTNDDWGKAKEQKRRFIREGVNHG